jgi:REP element-mobilizing transposase RayT
MTIKEKKHRLPKMIYRGEISVAFTVCLKGDDNSFLEPETARIFVDILAKESAKADCIVPVYCFMPDHQHFIITGTSTQSDTYKAVVSYKQRTGFWMTSKRCGVRWQKDFFDHVIRTNDTIAVQIRYILDNPLRKGLV